MAAVSRYTSQAVNVLKNITQLRANYNKEARRNKCIEFLTKIKEGDNFLTYLKELMGNKEEELDEGQGITFPSKLTENEYLNAPADRKLELFMNSLREISPIEGCDPGLWLYVSIQALEKQIIKPTHLIAKGNGATKDSKSNKLLDAVLTNPAEKVRENPEYLNYTRLALRRLFGAISERGKKAIYTDAPFAKIYWQCHIAREVAGNSKKEIKQIIEFFDNKPRIYETLLEKMSSELTVISDINTRDAIVKFIVDEKTKITNEKEFRKLLNDIGTFSVSKNIGGLNVAENTEIIKQLHKDQTS